MDKKELIEMGWRQVMKALPFDGGPSSTRVMYMLAVVTACCVVLLLAVAFTFVYVWIGKADVIVAGALTGGITALIGFAGAAQGTKNKATAQVEIAEAQEDKKEDKHD